jgi:hypothetical protein
MSSVLEVMNAYLPPGWEKEKTARRSYYMCSEHAPSFSNFRSVFRSVRVLFKYPAQLGCTFCP